MIEQSTITCPKCGHETLEHMPKDACTIFYDCKGCGERLKPLPGDCCVFRSFGTVHAHRCKAAKHVVRTKHVRFGPTTEAIQSRRVMTGEVGSVERQLFLIGSGDTGSFSQTTMVLFYRRAPRK